MRPGKATPEPAVRVLDRQDVEVGEGGRVRADHAVHAHHAADAREGSGAAEERTEAAHPADRMGGARQAGAEGAPLHHVRAQRAEAPALEVVEAEDAARGLRGDDVELVLEAAI